MRLFRFFLLGILFALPAGPVLAADTCCRCNAPAESEDICVTRSYSQRAEPATQACVKLPGTFDLDGWTCEQIPSSQCKPVGTDAGVCQQGPQSALETKKQLDKGTHGEPVASIGAQQTTERPPAIIPNLNVPIPGFSFTGAEGSVTEETSSLLAQYLAAVYRYGISITAVAATVMFVFGAFQYLVGSAIPTVKRGKTIMQEAILGMILVFGANMILRTVNPATLTLDALYVGVIDPKLFIADIETIPQSEQGKRITLSSGGDITLPSAFCRGRACEEYCAGPVSQKPVPQIDNGMARQQDLVVVPAGPGLRMDGTRYMRPDAAEALARAGRIASTFPGGPYELVVGETFRSLEKQLDAACKILNGNKEREGAVASPGASPHGTGIAVDVSLYRNGVGLIVPLFPLSVQGERLSQTHAETLERIMVEAGFTHYCPEVWHFDFGRPISNEIRKKCPWPPIPPQR